MLSVKSFFFFSVVNVSCPLATKAILTERKTFFQHSFYDTRDEEDGIGCVDSIAGSSCTRAVQCVGQREGFLGHLHPVE